MRPKVKGILKNSIILSSWITYSRNVVISTCINNHKSSQVSLQMKRLSAKPQSSERHLKILLQPRNSYNSVADFLWSNRRFVIIYANCDHTVFIIGTP